MPIPEELLTAAAQTPFIAISDILESNLSDRANVIIPGCTWAEKDGTFMNVDGRIQRIKRAIEPPIGVNSEIQWLQEALVACGERKEILSAEAIFREAIPSLDYGKIGSLGVETNGSSSS